MPRSPACCWSLGLVGGAVAQDKFKLGMAVGGNTCCEWMKAQGDVARALAEQRGWDYVELSNNNDPATALKNAADLRAGRRRRRHPVQRPALGQPGDRRQVMAAAGIPIVTYDIADPGMYFVGIDNLAAGIAGGEELGMIIKEKWNCEPDLVISAEGAGAGIVNEWRTGGMRTGLKNICPDIPAGEVRLASRAAATPRSRCQPAPRPARRASRCQEDRASSASTTAACSA